MNSESEKIMSTFLRFILKSLQPDSLQLSEV